MNIEDLIQFTTDNTSEWGGLSITYNPHKGDYATLTKYIQDSIEISGGEFIDYFIDDEDMNGCIETDTCWKVTFAPELPSSHYDIIASSLRIALKYIYNISKLKPIVIDEVHTRDVSLRAKKNLIVHPEFDKKSKLIYCEIPALGISVHEEALGEFQEELEKMIGVLWREYALALDSELSFSAKVVKTNLLATFEEIKNMDQLSKTSYLDAIENFLNIDKFVSKNW